MIKLNIGKDLYLKGRIGWRGLSKDEYLKYSNYKIINATSLMDSYINWDSCGYISKERYDESEEIKLQENDILISKDGTLGKIGFVKNLNSCCTVSSGIFVLRNSKPEVVDFNYLYHILKSDIFKDFIRRNKAQGSTIQHLYQRDLENFEINLPDINEQKFVSNILDSIDYQIDRNNHLVQKLQVLAQSIFNKFYGRNIYTFNGTIGDLCHLYSGYSFKPSDYTKDGKYKLITIKNVNGTFIDTDKTDTLDTIPTKMKSICFLNKGDILLSLTGNVGRVSINSVSNCLLNQRVAKICCKDNKFKFYLYLLLTSNYYQQKMHQIANGTSQRNLSPLDVEKIKIFIPNDIDAFHDVVKDILNELCSLNSSSLNLGLLKNKLLPLLINGQLV